MRQSRKLTPTVLAVDWFHRGGARSTQRCFWPLVLLQTALVLSLIEKHPAVSARREVFGSSEGVVFELT